MGKMEKWKNGIMGTERRELGKWEKDGSGSNGH